MLFHDSRDIRYRTPSGAGVCFSRITLRAQATTLLDRVQLRLWWDDHEQLLDMTSVGDDFYEAQVTLGDHAGILWYYFIATRERTTKYYGNATDRLGGEGALYDQEPPSYQITVFDPAYRTPEWMRQGIMYQIFPDRFCRSDAYAPRIRDGYVHDNWNEAPHLFCDNERHDNEAVDFFGGNLQGVIEKLPYLAKLGVTVIYFNPLFQARSNHKYDTGDYMKIDPSFGTNEDFVCLAQEARHLGIRIILDGVFSHTGADSRYFNMLGRYDSIGAYQSQQSPYATWYKFDRWPDKYDCWWGFYTLPNTREEDAGFGDFIVRAHDSVVAHWLKLGSSGWRLDVADELPMDFLRQIRARVKSISRDGAVIGEVWEDASNKVAYNVMRSYCLGDTLDSCMNYPLRAALLDFMLGWIPAQTSMRRIASLQENYPTEFFYSLMNLIGSHDKPRIIDVLSGNPVVDPARAQRHARTLTPEEYALGRRRFLAVWQFVCAMPGMPCLYYADEAGQTGMSDPFCRGTYPWGHEDMELIRQVARINRTRLASDVFKTGECQFYAPCSDVLVVARRIVGGRDVFGKRQMNALAICALNRADREIPIHIPSDGFLPNSIRLKIAPVSARVYTCAVV